jgi:hypothetical protein
MEPSNGSLIIYYQHYLTITLNMSNVEVKILEGAKQALTALQIKEPRTPQQVE